MDAKTKAQNIIAPWLMLQYLRLLTINSHVVGFICIMSQCQRKCVFKIWESCYLPLLLQLFSLFYCRHYYRYSHFPFPLPPSVQTPCPFCLAIAILLSVKLSSLNTTLPLLKCSFSFSSESVPCLLNCMCGALQR